MRIRELLSTSSGGIDPTTGRGMIGKYEVVDLGLPSGLLWATCNVGATREAIYGDFYMYGKGAQTYYYEDSEYEGMENPLASSVDTATQVMGSGWRMPTQTELNELINNTAFSLYTIDGRYGGKFTSKTNPNAYVFFPFAGNYIDGNYQSYNRHCNVWSSTPKDNSNSYAFYCGDGYPSSPYKGVSDSPRNYGFSVRGVHT